MALRWVKTMWLAGLCASTCAAAPIQWVSRGPGGGGAFFSPCFNPHNPAEVYVKSDMSDLFRSTDAGRHWSTVDFRAMQGGNQYAWIQFTSNPLVAFGLSGSTLKKTLDGGASWSTLSFSGAYSLSVDPAATNRLLISDYGTLYISTNGGSTFVSRYSASDFHISGALWDGSTIYVGSRVGLLVSTNGGTSFALAGNTGIPGGQEMVSFAGSKAGGTTRFFCVTMDSVWPGIQAYDGPTYMGTYRLDYSSTGTWARATNGMGGDAGFFVAMPQTNTQVAWIGGSTQNGEPAVFRTTDGGASWQLSFRAAGNANVETGWSGDDPGPWNWRKWSYGEIALGFNACPTDPNRAILTDFGFVHITTNGGASWYAAYSHASDLNATNAAADKVKAYHGIGLEDTSCWFLTWPDSNTLFACFTDMRGILSTNAGRAWTFPPTLAYNSTYETVMHPTNGLMYGAMSSVHDLYAWDQYCQDNRIDGGSGEIMYSTNKGASWARFKNLSRPVVALALDPNNHNRLYASMVNSLSGGIYRTVNLGAGTNSTWTKLPSPARTQGHPYVIRILNDGTIVCSYSARISGDFTQSAGVFVSTDDGASWADRSHAGMMYYTKDVVIDPHDAAQNTWYTGVWSEWGNSSGLGGIYRTTNRGVAWTLITTNIDQVGSVTVHPSRSNEMYACTENDGLWLTTNLHVSIPSFTPVAEYPFRFPSRAFFNPWNSNEVWVTSFGNGLRLGRIAEPKPELTILSGATNLAIAAASGQRVIVSMSINLTTWQDLGTNIVLDESFAITNAATSGVQFFGARVAP